MAQQGTAEVVLPSLRLKPGTASAASAHQFEDEIFIITAGELFFNIGGTTLTATPGTVVLAPRGIRHHYQIRSEWARFTMIIIAGQLDGYFWELTQEASTDELPPLPTKPPSPEEIRRRTELSAAYGVSY